MKPFPESKIGLSKGAMRDLADYVYETALEVEHSQQEFDQHADAIDALLKANAHTIAVLEHRVHALRRDVLIISSCSFLLLALLVLLTH